MYENKKIGEIKTKQQRRTICFMEMKIENEECHKEKLFHQKLEILFL